MPKFSWHAIERLTLRGVTQEDVANLIYQGNPFRYFHDGRWKLGYYDAARQLLIGMVHDEVTTVIVDVTPEYVDRLRTRRPR